MPKPTSVLDTADWSLAIPLASPGPLDFSGGRLKAAVTTVQGGAPIATATSDDGSLAFVPASGSRAAYFKVDLPVEGRTWRTKTVVSVAADILWYPDPNDPAPADWLGRVFFVVHPGTNSAGIALPAQAPVLIPAQPYEGRIATEPMVVGPQGPIDRSYTDEKVAVLEGKLAAATDQSFVYALVFG